MSANFLSLWVWDLMHMGVIGNDNNSGFDHPPLANSTAPENKTSASFLSTLLRKYHFVYSKLVYISIYKSKKKSVQISWFLTVGDNLRKTKQVWRPCKQANFSIVFHILQQLRLQIQKKISCWPLYDLTKFWYAKLLMIMALLILLSENEICQWVYL